MTRPLTRLVLTIAAALSALLFAYERVLAQAGGGLQTPQTGVVLVKLSPPIYMPLARQARITGDVKIQLAIRRDGSVASAHVVSGHPMLEQGALESAQKSIFECRNCQEDANPYLLIYTFALHDDGRDCGPPKIDKQWHVRSSKCLYLWKCKLMRTFGVANPPNPNPEVTQSQNRVTVLAGIACVDTETSHSHEATLAKTSRQHSLRYARR